jgi:hypothetical protein
MLGGGSVHGPQAPAKLIAFLAALAVACAVCAPVLAASGGTSVAAAHHRPRKPAAHATRWVNPLARRAMWIWELQFTDGGNLDSIISSAHRYGIGTVMIKSSDGTTFWSSQFTPQIVAALHRAGLKVCAWQYVYGNHPVTEAYMGAEAAKAGADCLLIDAETEYEGKYIAAQTYLGRLRDLVGARYPLALAGFPYIDFHPGFPYSVFLGPGGAQFNVPQMYWADIGVTADTVFAHTYSYNRIYGRPMYPLGQLYNSPPWYQIVRFRKLSRVYGASNVSWWDWQDATPSEWIDISRPAGAIPGYVPDMAMASIGAGATGDLVVWAQEHLISAGDPVGVDGGFGPATLAAVQAFQTAHGLVSDGIVGPETWAALLHYPPARIVWGIRASVRHSTLVQAARAGGRGVILDEPVPKSATRPAKRDEIARAGGAGPRKPPPQPAPVS